MTTKLGPDDPVHFFSPKEWFDQFEPWYSANPQAGRGQWCARHWAPAPCLHANGIGAAAELMSAFIDLPEVAQLADRKAENLNRAMDKLSPVCCHLGDQKMYEIWGHWPPAQPRHNQPSSAQDHG